MAHGFCSVHQMQVFSIRERFESMGDHFRALIVGAVPNAATLCPLQSSRSQRVFPGRRVLRRDKGPVDAA